MFKGSFEDIVLKKDGFLRGPFGGDLKKEIFVPKCESTYKVYEQSVILEEDERLGTYYISKQYFEDKMSKFEVKPGDFIVSCSGVNYGSIFRLPNKIEKGIINQALLRIRLDEKIIDPDYFYYYFKSYIAKVITGGTGDSTIPNFPPMTVVKKIPIEIPNIKEQKKIGKILKNIDDKIKNNKCINLELESVAETIYDYWFLQFEFPNEEGKPYKSSGGKMVWNEELKREIPEGWECVKLDEIFNFVKGKIPTEIFCECNETHSIPYLTIEAINNNNCEYCSEENMILTDGEVLMVMDGAASSEVYVGNKGAIGSTFCKLELKDKLVSNELLYLIMKKYELIFKKVNTGSTVPHANKNYINNFKICLPKDNIQLEKMQNQIIMNIKQINMSKCENKELASLRDFILPLLMNGQVGFRELALAED